MNTEIITNSNVPSDELFRTAFCVALVRFKAKYAKHHLPGIAALACAMKNCTSAVVMVWWCCGGAVVVLWWCCGGAVVVLWWWCGGAVVVRWKVQRHVLVAAEHALCYAFTLAG